MTEEQLKRGSYLLDQIAKWERNAMKVKQHIPRGHEIIDRPFIIEMDIGELMFSVPGGYGLLPYLLERLEVSIDDYIAKLKKEFEEL